MNGCAELVGVSTGKWFVGQTDDGGDIHPQIRQDGRHFKRMRKIRIAGGTLLGAVSLHRINIGAVEDILVGVRRISLDPLDEFKLPHHAGGTHLLFI